jgi:hypothetical protein
MDGDTIVIKTVHVDKRAGAFYVQSFDSTAGKYPLFFQGTWMKKMPGEVPDADLGQAVREAMAASHAEDWPGGDMLRDEVARRRKDLFRLAGVRARSERQYQTGLSAVKLDHEPGGAQYKVTKFINRDPRKDMVGSDIEHMVPVECPDDVLGATIRGLLSDEGGEPG